MTTVELHAKHYANLGNLFEMKKGQDLDFAAISAAIKAHSIVSKRLSPQGKDDLVTNFVRYSHQKWQIHSRGNLTFAAFGLSVLLLLLYLPLSVFFESFISIGKKSGPVVIGIIAILPIFIVWFFSRFIDEKEELEELKSKLDSKSLVPVIGRVNRDIHYVRPMIKVGRHTILNMNFVAIESVEDYPDNRFAVAVSHLPENAKIANKPYVLRLPDNDILPRHGDWLIAYVSDDFIVGCDVIRVQ